MRLKPKGWEKFQQYKDRKPTWIKLHRDLLNNFAYSSVRIGTKATLPLLWLLACEYDDGIIDASIEELSFRIHIDKNTVEVAVQELLEYGFFEDVSDRTEAYKMVLRDRDREETEKRREEIYIHGNDKINSIFSEYIKIRKSKRYSVSDVVIKRLIKKLHQFSDKGHDPIEVISNAINGSWKDFYEPKRSKSDTNIAIASDWLNEQNTIDAEVINA